MKKILSAILVCCLLVGVAFSLVSCASGDIANGTYVCTVDDYEQTLVIKGDTITMKEMMDDENGIEMVYTYELNADKTEITLTFKEVKAIGSSEDVTATIEYINETMADAEPETSDYEATDNGFKVDGQEFVKQ